MAAALFVSDLHLCPTRPAATELFFDLLATIPGQAEALYILGDLFEYWAGDDDLDDPFNASIADALNKLSARGVKTYFLAGNRDFLIGPEFSRASAVELLAEPHLGDIGGRPTLILHGDSLCTNDLAYQEFCREVRSTAWRSSFLARPLAQRHNEIEALRVRSEEQKRLKPAAIMDVAADAVSALLRHYDYPRLIHGHTHRPGMQEHLVDGHRCERWVLGDWYGGASYLRCDESGCHALPWPA